MPVCLWLYTPDLYTGCHIPCFKYKRGPADVTALLILEKGMSMKRTCTCQTRR